jgi:hypothetical protein
LYVNREKPETFAKEYVVGFVRATCVVKSLRIQQPCQIDLRCANDGECGAGSGKAVL